MLRTADPARAPVRRFLPLCAVASAVLVACGGGGAPSSSLDATALRANVPPGVELPARAMPLDVTQHSVTRYPARTVGAGDTAATQDLLTGGLGKTGLGAPAAPSYANPDQPTAAELRRNALYSNYRGILDPSVAGGYGRFYGPNVKADGTVTADEGLIPGVEYVASLDDGSGRKRVVMAVQIPDAFDAARPCLVLGPSSGSRGVYGAIGTAGEWGLKKGCAVALTDAGKGVGLHDLGDDTVNRIDGTRATRAEAGALAQFAANVSDAARAAFNAVLPDRFALKHVHSQQNPEKDWGHDTLAAAQYAFYALNDHFAKQGRRPHFNKANTLVIAGSASNGGAAVVRAAELDQTGLIDGVVASEPVLQVPTAAGYAITFGGAPVAGYGKSLADYTTYGNLYQPCAQLAAPVPEFSVFNWMALTGMNTRAAARCTSLKEKGLVSGDTLAAQAADALARLQAFGWTPEHDQMHNSYWGLGNGAILSAMYPVAYGRFSVLDNVCGTSFSAVNALGFPVAATASAKAQSFATANGTANGTPASPVYDLSPGGSRAWQFAFSANGAQDFGLDTALCQRALVTGTNPVTGEALTATSTPTAAQSAAVRAGIAEVTVDGNLRGKPTLIASGRSDALVPVNHNSRAYAAFNAAVERGSNLRYIEVTHGQHFDTFIPFSGFDTRFIPLHVYFNQAMDLMYAHLTEGAPLPPSQVVRTTPRGGVPGLAPALMPSHIPPISMNPPAGDRIGLAGSTLAVPQ